MPCRPGRPGSTGAIGKRYGDPGRNGRPSRVACWPITGPGQPRSDGHMALAWHCQRGSVVLGGNAVDAWGRMPREDRKVTRWAKGERTVAFLIDRGRLERFEASDPAATANALVERATRRLEATAMAALANGDADGAYAAAYPRTGWPAKRSWPGSG